MRGGCVPRPRWQMSSARPPASRALGAAEPGNASRSRLVQRADACVQRADARVFVPGVGEAPGPAAGVAGDPQPPVEGPPGPPALIAADFTAPRHRPDAAAGPQGWRAGPMSL